jgi:hypothetical protein
MQSRQSLTLLMFNSNEANDEEAEVEGASA